MWASCVRIVKIKCVWHHRCFHFLLTAHLWHIFAWLGKSILFSGPEILAMDTSTCCTIGTEGRRRQGEAGGDRRGCPVLTRGGNSCHGRESWVMTFKAIVGLSVFIPRPADTRPKECVDSLMCLGHNLWPWSLSLLFFALWTPSLPRARLPPHL